MLHRYACSYNAVKSGEKPCFAFDGRELDAAVVERVLNALKQPPIEVLKGALAESIRAENARKDALEAERQRLYRRELLLREQFDACPPKYHPLHADLQEKLNSILLEMEAFKTRLRNEEATRPDQPTDEEIEELCRLASNIPELWVNPSVTNRERKQIIRCLISRVVTKATAETIEATIEWVSGSITILKLYRRRGKYNLIHELHEKGCNTREILDRLERGDTSTGQKWQIHRETLYNWYKRLGLRPHSRPSWYLNLQNEAVQLRKEGNNCDRIAGIFNDQGYKALSRKSWTPRMVFSLLTASNCRHDLEVLHCKLFVEARARGLNFSQMAREFKEKNIPRYNGKPWHKEAVARKWKELIHKYPEFKKRVGEA